MDIKFIKSLIGLFESSKLNSMEISEKEDGKDFSLRLDKGAYSYETVPVPTSAQGVAAPVAVQPVAAAPVPKGNAAIEYSEGVVDFNRVEDVKSPMVGVFYGASSPDSAPFVTKGSKVKKGDTLCIIEAMKLMNEVVAERDCEIVEVVAKSGELVEFGQVLFRVL